MVFQDTKYTASVLVCLLLIVFRMACPQLQVEHSMFAPFVVYRQVPDLKCAWHSSFGRSRAAAFRLFAACSKLVDQ
jgi:hypothetical protein